MVSRREFEGSIKVLDDDWGRPWPRSSGSPADIDLWFDAFSF
jgi:hypothetical protein